MFENRVVVARSVIRCFWKPRAGGSIGHPVVRVSCASLLCSRGARGTSLLCCCVRWRIILLRTVWGAGAVAIAVVVAVAVALYLLVVLLCPLACHPVASCLGGRICAIAVVVAVAVAPYLLVVVGLHLSGTVAFRSRDPGVGRQLEDNFNVPCSALPCHPGACRRSVGAPIGRFAGVYAAGVSSRRGLSGGREL